MTAICYRDGIMAADTVGWVADCRVKVPVRLKIRRAPNGSLYAGAGAQSEIEMFSDWMAQKTGKPDTFDRVDSFTALLAKPDGSLWICTHLLHFTQIEAPFFAIGAPAEFMLGALYAGCTAREAVTLAVLHTDGAGGDVQVERVCA